MDSKLMSQVLCKRSSQFTSNQWEQFMNELEQKSLFLCIESVSSAKAFVNPEVMIPVANKNDHIKIYSKEELEQKQLILNHQFITVEKTHA
jgi:hypothetical protein